MGRHGADPQTLPHRGHAPPQRLPEPGELTAAPCRSRRHTRQHAAGHPP